jgi:hypothetical protein
MSNEQPKPSQNYKTLQQQLQDAITVKKFPDGEHSNWTEIHRLRPILQKEFADAFNLKIVKQYPGNRRREALRILQQALNDEGHGWQDFDHVDHATRPGFDGEILISQPYGVAAELHQRLAEKFGYTFIQADEWTYYYPGKSHLFIVEVTREVIRKLRKARQT